MKRYEWEFPVVPERLQLQLRQITPEARQDHRSAVRGALLDRFVEAEPLADERSRASHTRLM